MPKIKEKEKEPKIKTLEELRNERIAKTIELYETTKTEDCLMEFFFNNKEMVNVIIDALTNKIPKEKVIKYVCQNHDALHLRYIFSAMRKCYSERMVKLFANMFFNKEQMDMICRGIDSGLSEEQIVSFANPNYSINMMEKIIVRETTRLKFLKPLLEKHKMYDFSKAYEVKDLLTQLDRNIKAEKYDNFDAYAEALIEVYNKEYEYIDALLYTYDDTPYVTMESVYVCRYREKSDMAKPYKAMTVCIRTRCGTKPYELKKSDLNFLIETMIKRNEEARQYIDKIELLRITINNIGSEITAIYKINEE